MMRSKEDGIVALRVSSGAQRPPEGGRVCTPGDRGECCQAAEGRRSRQLELEEEGRMRESVG